MKRANPQTAESKKEGVLRELSPVKIVRLNQKNCFILARSGALAK
jgi:hypothetical protein